MHATQPLQAQSWLQSTSSTSCTNLSTVLRCYKLLLETTYKTHRRLTCMAGSANVLLAAAWAGLRITYCIGQNHSQSASTMLEMRCVDCGLMQD